MLALGALGTAAIRARSSAFRRSLIQDIRLKAGLRAWSRTLQFSRGLGAAGRARHGKRRRTVLPPCRTRAETIAEKNIMTTCPNCGTSIGQLNIQIGKCSTCGHVFAAGGLDSLPLPFEKPCSRRKGPPHRRWPITRAKQILPRPVIRAASPCPAIRRLPIPIALPRPVIRAASPCPAIRRPPIPIVLPKPTIRAALPAPIDPQGADSHHLDKTFESGSVPAPVDPPAADSHHFAETYIRQPSPAPRLENRRFASHCRDLRIEQLSREG